MSTQKVTASATPTPAYLNALAEQVMLGAGIDTALDLEIELALFVPPTNSFMAVQPNAARTKLIYLLADGTTQTVRAHDWTMDRDHAGARLRLRAAELTKALAPAPANPTALEAAIANLEAFDRDGTILSEVENEVAFTENVALCLHELKRLRADQMRQPQYLSPDATDIRLIRDGVLPRCPCCDGTPTTFTRYFAYSGIYQSFVHCSRCDVQVFKNAHGHEDARNLAIAAWSRRSATDHRDIMRSYIGGYLEEGNLTSITHDRARELAVCATNGRVAVDDLMISQVLRSLMFERSDLPADANTIIYRKVDLA